MKTIKRLRAIVKNLVLRIKIYQYERKFIGILRRIENQDKVTVVFFVLFESMWKCDQLFKKLQKSDRFDPIIISFPLPEHPKKFSKENQEKVEIFFKAKQFPFIKGYDFEKNELLNISSLQPDIVFYQQPYNDGYDGLKIEDLWDRCLFCYIPYTYDIQVDSHFYNNLLQNIAWKIFIPSQMKLSYLQLMPLNDGKNLCVTGYPSADSFIWPDIKVSEWKQSDSNIKRIIWAPHHSIYKDDSLNYSNFLECADEMLELCRSYYGKLQFAFKPHPVLKRKLYNHLDWGIERTDKYYNEWATMPNSILQEGNYENLFITSDAMIHDSASFTVEYLYTKKPVLYFTKNDHDEYLSPFLRQCYQQHYLGYSVNDIVVFIENVILSGKDPMKKSREDFFNSNLMPPNGKSVAENIYDELLKV